MEEVDRFMKQAVLASRKACMSEQAWEKIAELGKQPAEIRTV
jgi:hypothetical protein